ncbi:hypothetical protein GCM10025867_23120 [Frondihabitans sucicola]|uniref:Major facilitator superfamily (MFS) profile domain-containing protein n=1 Tax=Frondihabitans sucicola TaxID=1268041 RepID=A0ABN6Y2A0_9MICO|nr:MFS transporter [Frondihabitans sucicola]BDZ50071.1 hypothetical protein GCM10025867_23120 [Frondihabitans sucicola]
MASSGRRIVLVVAILASFVAFLDGSIVTVALPALARDLGGGVTLQQWVVDGYLLTLGSLMLVAGSLSDTFGRVRILRAGLIGFGATSLLAAIAPNAELLIAARALQGVAGALLVPSSLAIITATFTGTAMAKAIGTWTAWTGVAFLIGPLAGGALVDTAGWRWVFGIVVLPVVVTLVLLARLPADAHRGTASAGAHVDVLGAVLGALGLAGPVFALIEGQRIGFDDPFILAALIGGVLCLVAFVVWERRAAHPMMPLRLFSVRAFSVGNLATIGIYASVSLGTLLIPLVVQEVGHLPATVSGLITLPTTVVSLLLSSTVGGLAGRFGPRPFMTVGPLITAAGFAWMLLTRDPLDVWWQILPGVLLFGLGMTVTVTPLTSTVLAQIAPDEAGIASAVNNAISRVAGLVAVAFVGVITGSVLDVAGFHRVIVVVVVLLVVSAVVSLVGLPRGVAAGRDPVPAGLAPSAPAAPSPAALPPEIEGDSAEDAPDRTEPAGETRFPFDFWRRRRDGRGTDGPGGSGGSRAVDDSAVEKRVVERLGAEVVEEAGSRFVHAPKVGRGRRRHEPVFGARSFGARSFGGGWARLGQAWPGSLVRQELAHRGEIRLRVEVVEDRRLHDESLPEPDRHRQEPGGPLVSGRLVEPLVLLGPGDEEIRVGVAEITEHVPEEFTHLTLDHRLTPDLEEQGRLREISRHSGKHVRHDLGRRRRGAARRVVAEVAHARADHLLRHGHHDVVLALEVAVDGARRQPRLRDDVGHRRSGEPLRRETAQRGCRDLVPPRLAVLLGHLRHGPPSRSVKKNIRS